MLLPRTVSSAGFERTSAAANAMRAWFGGFRIAGGLVGAIASFYRIRMTILRAEEKVKENVELRYEETKVGTLLFQRKERYAFASCLPSSKPSHAVTSLNVDSKDFNQDLLYPRWFELHSTVQLRISDKVLHWLGTANMAHVCSIISVYQTSSAQGVYTRPHSHQDRCSASARPCLDRIALQRGQSQQPMAFARMQS